MKKPELTATSVEKFLIEKFDSVSDLMQLSEGEESRAFSFDVGGRGYVLRVNSCADGFYLFSDLRSGEEELLQHGHKKRVIVAMSGLLHHEQI
ncbi:TPA: hypothetical protein G8Z36_005105 [Salmonella enterica]|uniref:Uncharacterized protein n=3 Tax=Salmonella TaxID=590 RepID=A0A708CBR3_SALTM|nr:hypothetical protein [Salmonella enterica]EBX3002563.1 hypothetical protein [Salmonella enterica subsp. enterica serovar Saintpaul]HCW2859365.1 hypothetical protein [Escherichia coli]AXH26352.1 hypothetical protein A5895_25370 [Salmonella enterica subsp. enterica]EBW4614238.1 hypothetical protein [Salmonella enterica subsp. enterica serovar Typhimurium]EBW4614471.1 hypothetical protein [Salmonella enterica subsp. enterica serovar Typhimurium]